MDLKDCKYSVLMSVYKNEKAEYFKIALESMINQTVKPDEIVIFEDGQLTDELYSVIDYFRNQYPEMMHICGFNNNHGLGPALEYGVKVCRNEIIARMDTDDISNIHRCEKQLKYLMNNENISVVGCNIQEFVDNENHVVGKRIVPQEDIDIKQYMKKRCPLNHVTVMFRKKDILAAGNYKKWFCNEDYYLWIRMYLNGCKFGNIDECLVNVRVGKEMYKRRGGIKYFISEKKLQLYMYNNKMISLSRCFINIFIRLIVQVFLPNSARGLVFKMLARSK